MADNNNMELNDEMMEQASGGTSVGMPFPKFKEGESVIVKGWESYSSVVMELKSYSSGMTWGWKYKVKIEKNTGGSSEYLETVMLEEELSKL